MTINTLAKTVLWFHKAVPRPTVKNLHTQLGVHFEEVAEMVTTLTAVDDETREALAAAHIALDRLAERLKKAQSQVVEIKPEDRTEFLDSLCDQTVTAAGVAHMAEMDFVPAMDVVNASNFSKFGPDGEPIFDANRKVIKGPAYRAPDLTMYV